MNMYTSRYRITLLIALPFQSVLCMNTSALVTNKERINYLQSLPKEMHAHIISHVFSEDDPTDQKFKYPVLVRQLTKEFAGDVLTYRDLARFHKRYQNHYIDFPKFFYSAERYTNYTIIGTIFSATKSMTTNLAIF